MARDVGTYIRTASGGIAWPLDPLPEDIHLFDIAHALSNVCRFSGHVSSFYSVAQHCVVVSELCPPEWARWGLLHDAAEAYMSDIPRPIKKQWPEYKEAERRLLAVILERFGLESFGGELPPIVKFADNYALYLEGIMLMPPDPDWGRCRAFVRADWAERFAAQCPKLPYAPWTPGVARKRWLERYEALSPEDQRGFKPAGRTT